MTLPAATARQLAINGPADGEEFPNEEGELVPPSQFVAAVHHGSLCCGEGYDEAEDHGDDACDCMPATRGLYTLDLDRSIADGQRWIYVYDREVFDVRREGSL